MKQKRKTFSCLLFCFVWPLAVNAQATIATVGGNSAGSGGSVSYTVGQISYSTVSGTNGSVAQGVQQPYEISIVTAIINAVEINLECIVFPNPTNRDLKLIIRIPAFENLHIQLFDMNGTPLQDKKIDIIECL
jgi:hypothetical protein